MNSISTDELKKLVRNVVLDLQQTVPIGISNRHIHLSRADFHRLFPDQEIESLRPLKQPGEYAAKQTVTLIGPKGQIERVRILGPYRSNSQVEIAQTDARNLGIKAPLRLSGNLSDAAPITLKSEYGQLTIPAAIVAKRHIHLNNRDLERLSLKADDLVSVEVVTGERKLIFNEVILRPNKNFVLEMHIDTDEANAAGIDNNTKARIIR